MTPPVDKTKCCASGCARAARMAIRTTRPTRAKLTTTVWWDDRTAPVQAARYCRVHGAALLADFSLVLVAPDAEAEAIVGAGEPA